VFRTISPNVESEESGMRDDSGMQDVAYTEVCQLRQCTDLTLVRVYIVQFMFRHHLEQVVYAVCLCHQAA